MTSRIDLLLGGDKPLTELAPFEPARASDVELDTPRPDLGDAGSPAAESGPAIALPPVDDFEHAGFSITPGARNVQHGRDLVYHLRNMAGRDVLAVQRALVFAHLRFRPPLFSYGWLARDEVRLLQARHGLTRTGVYDARAHEALLPFFDGYCRWLYTHADTAPPPIGRTPAERLTRAAWYLKAHAPMSYHEVRPFLLYRYGDAIGYPFDCSWLVTEAAYLAKIPDPNRSGYNGWGNTESLRYAGTAADRPAKGCICLYGTYGSTSNPAHTAICVGDDLVISHGAPGGPLLLPYDYRTPNGIRRIA